jgi:hypothetical protein
MLLGFGLRTEWMAAWTLAAVVAAGCGDDPALGGGNATEDTGGDTDSETEGSASVVEERVAAFVTARCEQMAECGCAGASDVDACVETSDAIWASRLLAGEQRGLVLDEACLVDNLVALETAACRWPSTVYAGEHLCERYCGVFHGDRPAGASCDGYDAVVSDCAAGLMCSAGVCVEPCGPLTGLSVGQYCVAEGSGPFEDCTEAAYCDWQTTTCQTYATAGESCQSINCGPGLGCDWQTQICVSAPTEGESCLAVPCADSLQCSYENDGTARCRARGLAGESCTNVACAEGLVCNGVTCEGPPGPGQPCPSGQCSDGAVCDWDINLCRARPSLGESCLFGQCADDLWCDSGTDPAGVCVSRKLNGEACTGHSQCADAYCPRGYCEARPAEGEDCTNLFICEPGLVCDGETCRSTDYRGPAACVYDGW